MDTIQEDNQDKISCVIFPNKNNCGGLYLSSLTGAKNLEKIKELNINAVVTALSGAKLDYPSDIILNRLILNLNAFDHKSFDLIIELQRTFKFIDECLKTGNVLVHCFTGMNRSPGIIIAYLMKTKNLTYQQAFKYLMKKRRVQLNDGFVNQLKQFEQSLIQQKSSLDAKAKESLDSKKQSKGSNSKDISQRSTDQQKEKIPSPKL